MLNGDGGDGDRTLAEAFAEKKGIKLLPML
jgi:hypothetical protein